MIEDAFVHLILIKTPYLKGKPTTQRKEGWGAITDESYPLVPNTKINTPNRRLTK